MLVVIRTNRKKNIRNHPCRTFTEGDDILPVRRIDWENLNREVEKVHSLLGVGAEEHLVGGSQVRNKYLMIS